MVPALQPLRGQDLIPELDPGSGRYTVRFARTEGDLDQVCQLRFEVFNRERGEGFPESWENERDRDHFDDFCQHLMVIDSKTDACVGTYRLQVQEMARAGRGFYSAGEFDLSGLPPAVIENLVELGRAAVARSHRSRRVLYLLWRGLVTYVESNGLTYFMGCSSFTSQDPTLGARAYRDLSAGGFVHPSLHAPPLPGFECDATMPLPAERVTYPPLFELYLRAGAKALGPPALDRAFRTIDFLTLVDMREIPPLLMGRIRRA